MTPKTQKKKTKVAIILASLALVGTMAIGGISAYFTDTDSATNTVTVGSIDIDLDEPNWNPADPEHTDITPDKEFDKNPQVTNVGDNDAFVFVQVSVPYRNVVTANEDGTKNASADTELFTYTVNNDWTEVGTPAKDTEHGVVVHTYAYGTSTACTALAPEATTSQAVFDKIKFVNVIEGQVDKETFDVDVKAYGIQTENVNGGKTNPTDVWTVVNNQTNG